MIFSDATPGDSAAKDFPENISGDTLANFRSLELNKDSIDLWKNKKQYAWIKTLDSLLRQEQRKSSKQPDISMPKVKSSALERFFQSAFLEYLFWFLAGGFVLFVIFKLFMSKGMFRRTTKAATSVAPEETVSMESGKDYRTLSRASAAAGDFRMATRYLFLLALQQLHEKELIAFAPDKTNSMYLQELPGSRRNGFARISLYYEYAWYGHAPLTTETFVGIEISFNAFLNTINN